jgi:hypothetical protein
MREDKRNRLLIGRMVRLLANDLDLRVEHLEWLPDTADCEYLRLVVGGGEKRIEFRKTLLKKNLAHQGMALEAAFAKVTRALRERA